MPLGDTEEDADDYIGEQLKVVAFSDDIIKDYLRRAGKRPLLKAEQEVQLMDAVEAGVFAQAVLDGEFVFNGQATTEELERLVRIGDEAREIMIESNLRWAIKIAARYRGRGLPFIDLIQEANQGLMRAVEKFDNRKSYKFSTYSMHWIRQTITRAIPDKGREIRLPVHIHEKVVKLARTESRLSQELGRTPTEQELAQELCLTERELKTVQEARKISNPLSIDTPMGDDQTLGDLIDVNDDTDFSDVVALQETQDVIQEILASFSERERFIVEHRFGLGGKPIKKLDEIAAELQVTRQAAQYTENRAMSKLRHPSRAQRLRGLLLQ